VSVSGRTGGRDETNVSRQRVGSGGGGECEM